MPVHRQQRDCLASGAYTETVSLLHVGRPITAGIKTADTHNNGVIKSSSLFSSQAACFLFVLRSHCTAAQHLQPVSSAAIFIPSIRPTAAAVLRPGSGLWQQWCWILPVIVEIIELHINNNIIKVSRSSGYSARSLQPCYPRETESSWLETASWMRWNKYTWGVITKVFFFI